MICVRCERMFDEAEGISIPNGGLVQQIIYDEHPWGMCLCTDCASPAELERRMAPVLARDAAPATYRVPGPDDATVIL